MEEHLIQEGSITENNLGSVLGGRSSIQIQHEKYPEGIRILHASEIAEAILEELVSIGRGIKAKMIKTLANFASHFKEKEPGEIIAADFSQGLQGYESPFPTQKPVTFVDFKNGNVVQTPAQISPIGD